MIGKISSLDERARDVLKLVVDAYLETGIPVGSKTLADALATKMGLSLSPATIRNVMASLESTGLLFSPHTSAGRVPTDLGLRLFVDGLLEIGDLSDDDTEKIEELLAGHGRSLPQILEQVTERLTGLSQCAGLVFAPKKEGGIKHIEFIWLEPGRALAVLVQGDGQVENRLVDIPSGILAEHLQRASNYLNARLTGKNLTEALKLVEEDLKAHRANIDTLTQKVVEQGLAVWSKAGEGSGTLIIKGQSKLLKHAKALEDLDTLQALFEALERTDTLHKLLKATGEAKGVKIYIGSENQLFGLTGCSLVISPFRDSGHKIVGAIGVIGPTRINYARIVPMVDYTSQVITRMLS